MSEVWNYSWMQRPDVMPEKAVSFDRSSAARQTLNSPAPLRMKEAMASVQSSAATAEAGELFQYVIGDVSLPRQRSAMIPIVTEEINMQRVSIFNAAVQPRHPLHGIRIENSTKVHLMQGPVTVLDEGSYAGDARLNELPSGAKQLISYALDFEMQVDVDQRGGTSQIQTARIINGVLETQRKQTSRYVYTLNNESDKQRSVVVEHPRRPQWELTDTHEPLESTAALHRFFVDVSPDAKEVFIVNEEQVISQSLHLTNLDVSALTLYATSGKIPEKVKRALNQAVVLKRAVQQSDRQIQQKQRQIKAITSEQERIRENMGSVERNSSYYKRLLSKLESQEDEIEKLQKDIAALQGSKNKQLQDLQEYLKGLNVN